jgi:hypothetical protein
MDVPVFVFAVSGLGAPITMRAAVAIGLIPKLSAFKRRAGETPALPGGPVRGSHGVFRGSLYTT